MAATWRGVFALVFALAACASAARIAALPHPGGASHVFIVAKIGVELASRGHDVCKINKELKL